MLSQLFILSPRGDAIISKDMRSDCPRDVAEVFFRHVKLNDPPPVFVCTCYPCHVICSGMHPVHYIESHQYISTSCLYLPLITYADIRWCTIFVCKACRHVFCGYYKSM